MEYQYRKFTLEKARAIMEKNGYNYTDHELQIIIDFLYKIAAIERKLYEERKQEKNDSQQYL
jgi:hypothetical protein